MNNCSNLKWLWAIFQALIAMALLSGCGGGGSDESNTTNGSDANLLELTIDGIALDQTFRTDQLNYSASVDFNQASVTSKPVSAGAGATILVNGAAVASGSTSAAIDLAVGLNPIDITVTSGDRSTTMTYTLSVSRAAASSNAILTDLGLAGANLDQLFQPTQTTYSASVGFLQTSVTLTPLTADAGVTLHVNGTEVVPGTASVIALSEGQNIISLNVTAEDGVTTQSYSIEISRDYASSFAQYTYLKASNAERDDLFGSSVAIWGDTLVVGAIGEDSGATSGESDNSAASAGAAYVFSRNGGTWSQLAYLKASNAEEYDRFSTSVAISEDSLVVGAPYEDSSASGGEADNPASNAGAAYTW